MATEGNKSAALFTALMLAFYGNWGWGIYRSFDRHGALHGFIAVGLPPYAWYRGVAALWEQPLWREKYSAETTNIARIALAERPKDAAKIIELSEAVVGRNKFVLSLPENVAIELRASFSGLLDAFPALQLRNACIAFGNAERRLEAENSLEHAEARIAKIPSVLAVWNEYKEGEKRSLQVLLSRRDIEEVVTDGERAVTALRAISIGTENSWDQLRKSCLEMSVVRESDIKPYDYTPWASLLAELKPQASAPKRTAF